MYIQENINNKNDQNNNNNKNIKLRSRLFYSLIFQEDYSTG